MYELGLQDL